MLFAISTGLTVQAISPILLPQDRYVVPGTFIFSIKGGTVKTEGTTSPGFKMTLRNTHDHTLSFDFDYLLDTLPPQGMQDLTPIELGESFTFTATEAFYWSGSGYDERSIVYGDVLGFSIYVVDAVDNIEWSYNGFIIIRGRP